MHIFLYCILILLTLTPSTRAFAHVRPLAMTTSSSNNNEAVWDPDQQIYVGGVIPNHNEAAVDEYLNSPNAVLRIFGYGSLCWGPGTGSLAKDGVTTELGRAIGYKRCWAQKSTDHRGFPSFPGIVCTLLRDDEVRDIRRSMDVDNTTTSNDDAPDENPCMTEGVVYTIPPDQVEDCLAELDFREKGGYARDVVEVLVDNDDGTTIVQNALLYRGTPDNPAFWNRALVDLPLAAAIISISLGPSGTNDAYLFNLDQFMSQNAYQSSSTANIDQLYLGDKDTSNLASMAKRLQKQQLYFLVGCGSNQHNQLLLQSERNTAGLVNNEEDAHDMKELVLCTDMKSDARVKQLAGGGGGHSALVTESGECFLWGWNDASQLGRNIIDDGSLPYPVTPKLDLKVECIALGFSHTLLIEQETAALYGFGSNERGQAAAPTESKTIDTPTRLYPDQRFVAIAAGLFHSAAITEDSGELITFGCSRFGQATSPWRPNDGSRLVKVACGRRHTIVLDEHGRVWTMGDNKYGQLGRLLTKNGDETTTKSSTPQLVDGPLGEKDADRSIVDIDSGWSHCVISLKDSDGLVQLFGWGRNDKGQLGLGTTYDVLAPTPLFRDVSIQSFSCGSESTMVVDAGGSGNELWGCGWNEHGNLGNGNDKDCLTLQQVTGARILAPPPSNGTGDVLLAAGGAHVMAIRMM